MFRAKTVLVITVIIVVLIIENVPGRKSVPVKHDFESNRFRSFLFRYRNKDILLPSRVTSLLTDYCTKSISCSNNINSTEDLYCFNTRLPYRSISLDLVPINDTMLIESRFEVFQNLQNFPKCWNVIQPYLCALYMPRCENNTLDLPSYEMCKIARIPCQYVYNFTNLFPKDIFNCDTYKPNCKNEMLDLRFNTTGICHYPLVPTEQSEHFYKNIEGCGMQCQNPLYTNEQHNEIHRLIAWASLICFILNAFTVITFIIDWKNANKYPALVIFYMNFCFMISSIGWLLQFYGPDSRTEILCRKDGTLRISEPSARENLSCVIVFVLVYYFSMASIVWFVILTYAWYVNFRVQGKAHEKINKQRAYFHLMAWSIPMILTITIMAFSEIDGDYITGICFVGHINNYARILFFLLPFITALSAGGYFLYNGLSTLIHLQIKSRDIISPKANSKIKSTIIRVGLFSILTYIYGLVTLYFNIYSIANKNDWDRNLETYIMCKQVNDVSAWPKECTMKAGPSFEMLKIQIICCFAASFTCSSWIWTRATLDAWLRYVRRKFGCDEESAPTKLQKHKVIAKAFAKRKDLYQNGRLSISLQHSLSDPVGMNFDLNSVPTNDDLSCTWAAALPKLVNRRDAITGIISSTHSSHGRNSMDSEISISRTRVSYESRRNSLDSQLSVQIVKETHKFNKKNRKRHKKREVTRNSTKELMCLLNEAVDSIHNPIKKQAVIKPNMNRRSAISGVDDNLIVGKNLLPLQDFRIA